jgi:hypothetical protein
MDQSDNNVRSVNRQTFFALAGAGSSADSGDSSPASSSRVLFLAGAAFLADAFFGFAAGASAS